MDNEPSTSLEADKNATAMVDLWTKSLKYMPGFSYEKLEKHLVVDAKKTPDGKPAGAFKHTKKGYKLFKAGYPRQLRVKPNVKKGGEAVYFLVRCNVNAEMKKKNYVVYVHLIQTTGEVDYAQCQCPAGVGGRCKHVAATLFQLLDYIELGLSDIPDEKTCTEEIQKWHIPRKDKAQEALLFEDLIFPQDTYDKDKKGRKRPVPKGKRDYISSKEKVSKGDLEHLKVGLQNAKSPCHLVEILQDTKCEPCQFNVNDLPSRQRITNAEDVVTKLDETAVRSGILENLTDVLDTAIIPDVEKCKKFVQQNLLVDNDMCRDIEKKHTKAK